MRTYFNRSSSGHCFARIEHQRVNDLFYLPGIDRRVPETGRNIDLAPQIRSIEREFGALRDQVGHGSNLFDRRASFRKRQHLTGEMGCVLGGLARFGQERHQVGRPVWSFDLGKPNVPGNDGQDIVQIVSNAAGQGAKGLQLACG